jgi:hypothetical protein
MNSLNKKQNNLVVNIHKYDSWLLIAVRNKFVRTKSRCQEDSWAGKNGKIFEKKREKKSEFLHLQSPRDEIRSENCHFLKGIKYKGALSH